MPQKWTHYLVVMAMILVLMLDWTVAGVKQSKDSLDKLLRFDVENIGSKIYVKTSGQVSTAQGTLVDRNPAEVVESPKSRESSIMLEDEPRLPFFIEDPKNSYIIKGRSAHLTCSVRFASEAHFRCNGRWLDTSSSRTRHMIDPETRTPYIRVIIEVSQNDVDSFFGPNKYWCQCVAWSGAGQVKSSKATVENAYLRRYFNLEPVGGRFVVGNELKLSCAPPEGAPQPTIQWLKNDKLLVPTADSNFLITQDGDLIIQTRSTSDSGNYTCLAKNVAMKRRSTTSVHVGVNGGWSGWSSWSGCGNRCGIGKERRLRTCTMPPPLNGGAHCRGDSIQTKTCTNLCRVNGGWTEWSSWSTCSPECLHRRRRTCTKPLPHNSGRVCPGPDIQSRNCSDGLCSESIKSSLGQDGNMMVLYGCLCSALVLLLLVVIATVVFVKYRKKSSSGFRTRNNGDRSRRYYPSAPHSGSVPSGDFCIIPTKVPPPCDPPTSHYPPAYSSYDYLHHDHITQLAPDYANMDGKLTPNFQNQFLPTLSPGSGYRDPVYPPPSFKPQIPRYSSSSDAKPIKDSALHPRFLRRYGSVGSNKDDALLSDRRVTFADNKMRISPEYDSGFEGDTRRNNLIHDSFSVNEELPIVDRLIPMSESPHEYITEQDESSSDEFPRQLTREESSD